jgi:N-methylhydantoinase A
VRAFNSTDRAAITALFEDTYRRLYSRPIPGVDIEILSWVVTISAPAQGELATEAPVRASEAKARARRRLFDPQAGEFQNVPIYWRGDLAPGAKIAGPAVITEDDTSTVVSPLFEAQIDKFGYIALTRREV